MNQREIIRDKAVRLINDWRDDWNKFVHDGLGVRLDDEQQEVLYSVQTSPRTSCASGTARGKDFVAACAAMSFMYLTPRWDKDKQLVSNTKVALTAPTDRQVKNIMMPEISRLYNMAKNRGVHLPGRLTAYDIRTAHDEWFLTGFKADEHNHEAWSGFHAVNTMFVITEASGVSDTIFDAIEGNLQGNSRILLVFNYNTPVGYAARSQKSPRWNRFSLNSLNAPNIREKRIVIPGQVDYEWITDKLDTWCTSISAEDVMEEFDDFQFEGQWYRPEDLFRIKVLGKAPKVGEDVLIPQQWIDLAQERWRKFAGNPSGRRRLGVDVAGMGRDSTVMCDRHGDYVHPFKKRNSGGVADHMKIAGEVKNWLTVNPTGVASIDTIGEGAGVYSRLEELGLGKRTISCKYSEAAKILDKELTDITGQYKFANLRAYLFWCVRDWLNPKNNASAMLPPEVGLAQEATEIKWSFRSDGKILIEPKEDIKKRLGRSTDEFDALANTFCPIKVRKPVDIASLAKKLY